MRQQYIQTDTLDQAKNEAPWAAKIVEVEEGFMAFESIDDYHTWANQK